MTKWRRTRQVSKPVNNQYAWLQKYWGGYRLQLTVMCHRDADYSCAQSRKIEKKNSRLCTPWAYFTNGPNAAASIAPTLIRHWRLMIIGLMGDVCMRFNVNSWEKYVYIQCLRSNSKCVLIHGRTIHWRVTIDMWEQVLMRHSWC